MKYNPLTSNNLKIFTGFEGLRGRKGERGPIGDFGPDGLDGPEGLKGLKGYEGTPYPVDSIKRPLPGYDGSKGEKGEQGDKGYAGRPGLIGYRGLKGKAHTFIVSNIFIIFSCHFRLSRFTRLNWLCWSTRLQRRKRIPRSSWTFWLR